MTLCLDDSGDEVDEYGTCTCVYECPIDCSTGYSCDYYLGVGTGSTNGKCNNTNNIDADGYTGDCGSCPSPDGHTNCYDCDEATQCCDYKGRNLNNLSNTTSTIEIGNDEIHQTRISWKRGYNGTDALYVGTLTIQVEKRSSGTIWNLLSYDTDEHTTCGTRHLDTGDPDASGYPTSPDEDTSTSNRLYWHPEKFFNGILGDVFNAIGDCASYPSTCNDFRIKVYSSGTGQTKNSPWFKIKDDIRAGCTDSLANGDLDGNGIYDENASYDDGSCRYTGCADSNAANYSCGSNADVDLQGSYTCGAATDADEGDSGYDYTISDMSDDGLCEFFPIAVISHSPSELDEGTNIEITANSSVVHDNGEYTCSQCTGGLTYTWTITDTEGNSYAPVISNTHTLNFPIPYMEGVSYGGGGIITVDLQIENEQNWTSEQLDYLITVGDVDIIGTQLSSFSSIYIPGGDTYTLIGCYLPPNDDGYTMGDLLNSSFFLPDVNPDELEGEDPTPQTYMTGDLAYIIQCANADCNQGEENLSNGFFNYINGVGWIGPDIKLQPGMGIKLQTENAGWFRWTLPVE